MLRRIFEHPAVKLLYFGVDDASHPGKALSFKMSDEIIGWIKTMSLKEYTKLINSLNKIGTVEPLLPEKE